MKIEKINEYSLRFTLTKEDLEERNMTLKDLVTDNLKTQNFIRDLMFQALDEFEFDTMDKPLIVEASPNMNEGIVITVSRFDKQNYDNDSINKIKSLTPSALSSRKFIAGKIDEYDDKMDEGEINEENDDTGKAFSDSSKNNEHFDAHSEKANYSRPFNASSQKYESKKDSDSFQSSSPFNSRIAIYYFKNIDELCAACERITKVFSGESSVYKYNNKFYMVLNNSNPEDKIMLSDIAPMLAEYGTYNYSNVISKYFLEEHGEVFISKDAVKKAALL